MPVYNINKLNAFKKLRNLTLKELSIITGVPHSSLSKIFTGFNKTPQIDVLLKIASALKCSIDDFIDYETESVSPYYYDRQVSRIAQKIYDDKDLKILFETAVKLPCEDIKAAAEILNRLYIAHGKPVL